MAAFGTFLVSSALHHFHVGCSFPITPGVPSPSAPGFALSKHLLLLPHAHPLAVPSVPILPSRRCCLTENLISVPSSCHSALGFSPFPDPWGVADAGDRLALDMPSGKSVRTCNKQQLWCLWLHVRGQMAQEDPHSSSGCRCFAAWLGCRIGTAGVGLQNSPRLFQGLTVSLQHPLLGPGARPATATSG